MQDVGRFIESRSVSVNNNCSTRKRGLCATRVILCCSTNVVRFYLQCVLSRDAVVVQAIAALLFSFVNYF